MKRRAFLRNSTGLAGLSLTGLAINPAESASRPADLKITDIRGCTVRAGGENYPIIKIYTNQDVYGLGEVRDSGRLSQALIYKSFLVGQDPLNIEGILKRIKPMAGQSRNGGGYSAIDMALCDIAGKVLGIPAYRLFGSKRRSKITAYCDTPSESDPEVYKALMKKRLDMGFTHYKMDLQKRLIQDKPGALSGQSPTDKGLAYWGEYVEAVRSVIGYDKVLGADHFGYLNVDDGIRLGKAMEKYSLAYIEDVINWDRTNSIQLNKMITDGSPTPTLNGEDLFGLEAFRPWIENHAVDIIHPDMETSGGIIETKKIADYANMFGIPVMFHFAGSPVGCIASLHCACLVDDFISMENHAVDTPWWGDLVTGVEKPIINKGEYTVPEKPGLGVELNEEVVKQHLIIPGYFEPTPQFDKPMVGTHFGIPVDAIKK
ncbi:mandelate racemase/muconate lactonizing enzyme family protein [Haliscomenobacter sp.]|uniref:mandelate racemase/muconate lactonizing enzyme family protein n=1 Tax=Haliscomenobacter sp. TaxID=2717303 RepID=UPI003593120D